MDEFDETLEEVEETEDISETEAELSGAERAAQYVRDCGWDKAADYVARHFEGDDTYEEGDVIHVSTRNQAYEGQELRGVPFSRQEVELGDNVRISGVFPEFDSRHTVDLGDVRGMSLHQQFTRCKEDFQAHMYDSPEMLDGVTFGQMEKMDKPHGYAPEGYTWTHEGPVGLYSLTDSETHKNVGHTGSNSFA